MQLMGLLKLRQGEQTHMLAQLIQYKIISPGLPKVPPFCSICESAIGDLIDVQSIESVGCCRCCEHELFEPNREKWELGWRPAPKEIESARNSRVFVSR